MNDQCGWYFAPAAIQFFKSVFCSAVSSAGGIKGRRMEVSGANGSREASNKADLGVAQG